MACVLGRPGITFHPHNYAFRLISPYSNATGAISVLRGAKEEGGMEYGCYTISKSDTGWTICASGSAVLDCKQKRTALTAAIRAKQLMLLDRAAMDRPNAMENTPTAAMLAAGYVRRDK
jgi:hypothetical protein